MNPWQTWLNTLSQFQTQARQAQSATASQWGSQFSSPAATQFQTQWTKACQQWQQSLEGISSTPASFWESFASIQSARARTLSTLWQQQPQYIAQLFQCTSFPQVIECLTRWNGHTLTSLINLNITTQAHTGNFMSQFQRQSPFSNTGTQALASMWKSGFTTTPSTSQFSNAFTSSFTEAANAFKKSFTPSTGTTTSSSQSSATTSQPASTSTPQAATSSFTQQATPATSQSSTQNTSGVTGSVTASTTSSHGQLNLMSTPSPVATTTTSLSTTESPIISSTANSVMRSSTGSTIASAAARRSVVARRSSSNRRRAAR